MADVRIIAHRGASADAPENTLAAFALAKEQGAGWMEIDVQLGADGEPLVFHDWDLERLCGQPGDLGRLRLDEVRKLRVRGEPVPTLREVLLSADRPEGVVLELKSRGWVDTEVAARTAELLREVRALDRGPVVVSSFNPLCLWRMRRRATEVPRGLLAAARLPLSLRRLWGRLPAAPSELHLQASMIAPQHLAWAAQHPERGVIAWTVNDPAEARRLATLGVRGIITDVPARIWPVGQIR